MIDIISQLCDSLLNGKNSNKNIAITIIVLLLIGLNLLGIDLCTLSNNAYSTIILSIISIIIIAVVSGAMLSKLNTLNEKSTIFVNRAQLGETIKEDVDLIESQVIKLLDNQIQMINSCRVLMEEINGIPNVKFLKMLFELKISSVQYEIFKHCITYTLTTNECSQKIVLNTLKRNIETIEDDFTKFIRKNLKKYNINENLSDMLSNKLFLNTDIIIEELERDKKLNEKLYIISDILNHMEDDMEEDIIEYLKNIQIEVLNQN